MLLRPLLLLACAAFLSTLVAGGADRRVRRLAASDGAPESASKTRLTSSADPLCDITYCGVKRQTRIFGSDYCSAPHGIKDQPCLGPATNWHGALVTPVAPFATRMTFKSFCSNPAFVVMKLQNTPALQAEAGAARAKRGGTLNRHNSGEESKIALGQWCAAARPELETQFAPGALDAHMGVRLYKDATQPGARDDAMHTVGSAVDAARAARVARVTASRLACKAATDGPDPNGCVTLPQTQAMAVSGGSCGTLVAAATMRGLVETVTLSCAGGVLTATVAATAGLAPLASPPPCRREASMIPLDVEWAALAVALVEAASANFFAPGDAAERAWSALRARLSAHAMASRGIPHALRPWAWRFLASNPKWARTAGFMQQNDDSLAHYFARLVQEAADAADRHCGEHTGGRILAKSPCEGMGQIVKDLKRTNNPRLFATTPLLPKPTVVDELPTRAFVSESLRAINARSDAAHAAHNAEYFQALLDISEAVEVFFAPAHRPGGAAAGLPPQRDLASTSEYSQDSSPLCTFFLTARLPSDAAFLVRTYMLSALMDSTRAERANLMDVWANPQRAAHSSFIIDAIERDADIRVILDTVPMRGAPDVVLPKEAVQHLMFQPPVTLQEAFLQNLPWYSRDSELALRATDLQLVLPPERARLVAAAGLNAFFSLYQESLAARPLPERQASLQCSFEALIALSDNPIVSDLYSPSVDKWWDRTYGAVGMAAV